MSHWYENGRVNRVVYGTPDPGLPIEGDPPPEDVTKDFEPQDWLDLAEACLDQADLPAHHVELQKRCERLTRHMQKVQDQLL